MRETLGADGVSWKMNFIDSIMKVQLAKETNNREGLPRDRTFVESAQDMIDASAREEDARMDVDDGRWNRVPYHRTRNPSTPWKRREPRDSGKDRGTGRERRPNQGRIRNGGGNEDRKCHGYGKVGRLVAQCPPNRCFECSNEGHKARQCPYMYKRAETGQGEPMKINLQRIRWKRREVYRPSESSRETSKASGTEGGGRGGRSKKPPSSRWRRVSKGMRSRQES
ncbi:DNA-binding protein HEXBP-like [Halyomorpha halys]|uniref:DNA-binding protein HEXBP-like n=1 Tax=Halyomorpha halys TaxID=286706 RepID=UPI0006D50067|nr:ATP-dependent RNA helicase glh-2-like [Halyomorpha halys]